MTKTIFIVSLLFLLTSCNQSGNCPSNETSTKEIQQEDTDKPLVTKESCDTPSDPETPTDPQDPEDPEEPSEELPPEASMFEINAILNKFDVHDEEKVRRAFEIIKKVVASREFRDRVVNFEYKGQKVFVDNDGKSNEEIYQTLLDGSENLNPGVNNQMDLELELYYSSRNTVGYTYPSKNKIWMNTKYFDPYTPCEVARNVFHEWTHKLGFKHDSSNTASRKSSVPYAIGSIIEELGKQYE